VPPTAQPTHLVRPHRRSRFASAFSLILLTLIFGGCAAMKRVGQDMELRIQLRHYFNEQHVQVDHGKNSLYVRFVDSPLNNRGHAERLDRSRQTAQYIKAHYPAVNEVNRMLISFLASSGRLDLNPKPVDIFGFDRTPELVFDQTVQRSDPIVYADNKHANASYFASRDETDIGITNLQLSGTLNNGVSLVPHFTVHGNATVSGGKIVTAKAVTFDFASYSPQATFGKDPPLILIGNGATIAKVTARNLSSSTRAEFLIAEIPMPQFLQMTKAEQVTLRLGTKDYDLTPDQLAGLRDMGQYAGTRAPNVAHP